MCLHNIRTPMCTESTLKKDNGDMKDNATCSTTNDMTANPAYGTTSGIMAAYDSTANPWVCDDDELIVMHKNPTYATSAEKCPIIFRHHQTCMEWTEATDAGDIK